MVLTTGQLLAHEIRILVQGNGHQFPNQDALIKFESDVAKLLKGWYGDAPAVILPGVRPPVEVAA